MRLDSFDIFELELNELSLKEKIKKLDDLDIRNRKQLKDMKRLVQQLQMSLD